MSGSRTSDEGNFSLVILHEKDLDVTTELDGGAPALKSDHWLMTSQSNQVEGDVSDTVREIAIGKADFAIRALADHQGGWVSVVSDTVIEDPDTGLPMGKPRDSIEAERMLRRLSGRRHLVHSCTGVITPSNTMGREMFSDRSQGAFGALV